MMSIIIFKKVKIWPIKVYVIVMILDNSLSDMHKNTQ